MALGWRSRRGIVYGLDVSITAPPCHIGGDIKALIPGPVTLSD